MIQPVVFAFSDKNINLIEKLHFSKYNKESYEIVIYGNQEMDSDIYISKYYKNKENIKQDDFKIYVVLEILKTYNNPILIWDEEDEFIKDTFREIIIFSEFFKI